MPTPEEIEAAKGLHPATKEWSEETDFGKVNPIEMHPGFQHLPMKDDNPVKPKGLRIVEECEGSGEPYFVIRAKDILAIMTLVEYERLIDTYRPSAHVMAQQIADIREDFSLWMEAHPDQVKLPD